MPETILTPADIDNYVNGGLTDAELTQALELQERYGLPGNVSPVQIARLLRGAAAQLLTTHPIEGDDVNHASNHQGRINP